MPTNTSRYDPMCLEQYEKPPELLHFQWEGRDCGYNVYRYALVDVIDHNKIDPEHKKTKEEQNLTHKQIKERYLKNA